MVQEAVGPDSEVVGCRRGREPQAAEEEPSAKRQMINGEAVDAAEAVGRDEASGLHGVGAEASLEGKAAKKATIRTYVESLLFPGEAPEKRSTTAADIMSSWAAYLDVYGGNTFASGGVPGTTASGGARADVDASSPVSGGAFLSAEPRPATTSPPADEESCAAAARAVAAPVEKEVSGTSVRGDAGEPTAGFALTGLRPDIAMWAP
uniref:Uncharacterized protein n=1 Tax=Alexandrium monilatum TaxID=311494 RepID=A0A7S4UR58_9DINO|mmetsp:Transcript_33369/g.99394  ORF Transcript_33369/g.99394 Transcript_33369/m.99394 type:complete len:207 (+) Transcript_33369:40-660(+)